jgi:hypothetical protein
MNNPIQVSAPLGENTAPRIATMYDLTATNSGKLLARFSSDTDAHHIAQALPGSQVKESLCAEVDGQWVALDPAGRQVHFVTDWCLEICPAGCVIVNGDFTYPLKRDTACLAYFTLAHVDEGLLIANLLAALESVVEPEPPAHQSDVLPRAIGPRPHLFELGQHLGHLRLGVPDGHRQINRATTDDGAWGE